uniref:Uncharacterized protein n=1 Tax=viral metagenome TaxID=1070528 RepID=A0A6C0AZT0_9ZZZZ
MNNTATEVFEEFRSRLTNINKEYIKRLLLSMTMYCDTTHPKGRVPHALFDNNEACSVFDIKRKLREFLSDAPKGYLMLTGPEVIGLTFGPEAQEQYETLLDKYQDMDEEAGHGVDEDYDGYSGHGVGPEESDEQILTSMEEVDGGKRRKTKRRKTKRRKTMKRKNKTRKSKSKKSKGRR